MQLEAKSTNLSTETPVRNAFSEAFLEQAREHQALRALDAAPAARQAVLAGPWTIRRVERGHGRFWAIARDGEPAEDAGNPGALVLSRDLALHLAAALPAAGSAPRLELAEKPKPLGHSLHDGKYFHGHVAAELVGSLGHPEDLTKTLQATRALAAHLPSLTHLLRSLGFPALVLLGQELARRLES